MAVYTQNFWGLTWSIVHKSGHFVKERRPNNWELHMKKGGWIILDVITTNWKRLQNSHLLSLQRTKINIICYQLLEGQNSLKIKIETEKLKRPWALREIKRQVHFESKSGVQNGLETVFVEEKGEYKFL